MKKKNGKIIDISKIKSNIKETHAAFIKSVGETPLIIDADEGINLVRVSSKIMAVIYCLRDEKVIDCFEPNNNSSMYISYILSKNGYNSRVVVATDGKQIFLKPLDFLIEFGWSKPHLKIISVEDVDSFNWESFSSDLLSFVHEVIYRRKESISLRFFCDK